MLKKIMMAAVAVGALALNAPVAQAAEPVYDCSLDANRNEIATGQNYEGAVFGFVADSDGDAVSIRCYITVNGSEVGAEASGSGTGFAVAAGPVSFAATPEDDVDVCADVNGAFAECFQAEHSQFPPQEVIDAIDGVFQIIADATAPVDPIVCGALQGANVPATVNGLGIALTFDEDDCDIYVNGVLIIDFVPYGA